MRFGIALRASDSCEVLKRASALAEQVGFQSVWVRHVDRLERDVYVALAICAFNTSRVKIGPMAANPYTRHPGLIASAIATLNELSSGRAVLTLGAGGYSLPPLGFKRQEPVATCRDAIIAFRSLFRGEEVTISSKTFNMSSTKLSVGGPHVIPIYIAATGPRMLRLGGEIADGVVINVGTDPRCISYALKEIRLATPTRNVELDPPKIICLVHGCAISKQRSEAVDSVKLQIAVVLTNLPKEIMDIIGLSEAESSLIRKHFQRRDPSGIKQLVRDEVVERFTIAGSPDDCLQRFESLRKSGINDFLIYLQETGGQKMTDAISTFGKVIIQHE